VLIVFVLVKLNFIWACEDKKSKHKFAEKLKIQDFFEFFKTLFENYAFS